MPLTIGTNIESLRAQRQLSRTTSKLGDVFTRLSTGLRINKASDDAAGLAIADSLNADSKVYTQAIRNLNDGISVLNIADSTVSELTNIVISLQELASQAANGALSNTQREALDTEAQALSNEFFRISRSAEFNNKALFDGSYEGGLRLQAGYGTNGSINGTLGEYLADGTFTQISSNSDPAGVSDFSITDINNDGNLDAVISTGGTTIETLLGDGSGNFTHSNTLTLSGASDSNLIDDFNDDGYKDIITDSGSAILIYLGDGDGSFESSSTTIASGMGPSYEMESGDFNGDNITDFAATNRSGNGQVFLGDGDGGFTQSATIARSSSIEVGDVTGDGIDDIVTSANYSEPVTVHVGNGDGTFSTVSFEGGTYNGAGLGGGDFNGDGLYDIVTSDYYSTDTDVFLSNGDGTFTQSDTLTGRVAGAINGRNTKTADLNGDQILDIVNFSGGNPLIHYGNGDGTFSDETSFTTSLVSQRVGIADFNNDGVSDILALTNGSAQLLKGNTTDGIEALQDFSIATISEAKDALSQFTNRLSVLTLQAGEIGALESRVNIAENFITSTNTNVIAAESRIRDADIAQDAAELVKLQILQQASVSILTQANLQPNLVLELLKEDSE